jgi:hypothetical protein
VSAGTQAVRRTADSPWPERLARLGLAARGVLYIVVAILALQLAFGHRSENTSQSGALQELADKPGGSIVLWLIAVGLIAYTLWRLLSAAFGPRFDPIADDAQGRLKALGEAVGHGILAGLAVRVATGGSGGSGGGGQRETATVLSWPGGQFLVGAVGLGIAIGGVVLAVLGWKADFTKELVRARRAVVELGRTGRIARGVVFVVIGILVLVGAITYDPDKAKGLDGALRTLAGEPYGQWLLAAVALGLLAYGLYGLAEARLRRMS